MWVNDLHRQLEVVIRTMMTEIKARNPADFTEGGRGWTCPHMKRLDELLAQIDPETPVDSAP